MKGNEDVLYLVGVNLLLLPPTHYPEVHSTNGLRAFRAFGTIAASWSRFFSIRLGVQSIVHLKLCSKNHLCGFSDSEGLSNDQTTP